MKLIFLNSYGEKRVIAEPKNEHEAVKEMYKFCEEHNFKIHFYRSWIEDDGRKWFDCGSWSEFFYLELEDGGTWAEGES